MDLRKKLKKRGPGVEIFPQAALTHASSTDAAAVTHEVVSYSANLSACKYAPRHNRRLRIHPKGTS